MVRELIVFLCFITYLSPGLMLSKPFFQWTWTPGREYSQVRVTASPSLASTCFKWWMNSAGMARSDNEEVFAYYNFSNVILYNLPEMFDPQQPRDK